MTKNKAFISFVLQYFFLIASMIAYASESDEALRLPLDVVPVAQSVALTLDPAKDDYSGRTVIDLLAQKPFFSFQLHAEGPVFTTASLVSIRGEVTSLTCATVSEAQHIVSLTSHTPLSTGYYKLHIDFTAKYRRDGVGLYKTINRGDAYLFTQFEDRHARKAFPCFDEPTCKINWQLTITVPAELEVVSNAAAAGENRHAEWKTVEFGRTPPMPSYIVSLAVGPLESVSVPGLCVPGRIITARGQAGLAAEAARLAPPLISRLEEYFGIPYPYAKLDQIAVPEFVYGAMENAGLITYSDRILLMDPEHASLNQRRRLANIMAHEMAHMWFGDLVTMAWWDDLWLNEAFADWICARVVEQQFPEFRIKIQQIREVKKAMLSDALPSITAIRRKVTANTGTGQLADELTYSKGKGILNMVENWITPETFQSAMHAYFLKHKWGNTSASDLWEAFSVTCGDDITGMLATFIEKPGVPLVSLDVESGDTLHLTQRRFNNLGDPQLSGAWKIPVVLNWSKDGIIHRERILLKEATQKLSIPGLADADWLYPNADECGYYRWNVSSALNARLVKNVSVLRPVERVGLLDNAAALFSAGLIDGREYLTYVSAFAADQDPDVHVSVIECISSLRDTFITTGSLQAYIAYRRAVFLPILERIGMQPAVGESPHCGPLRQSLYAALGYEVADPAIIAECRRLAALFLQNPLLVDPALRSVAVSVAAYHGDLQYLKALMTALEQAQSPIMRSAVISALGSFKDPQLAEKALVYSLTPALNSTEFLSVLWGLGNISEVRSLAVDWSMAHYDDIVGKAPPEYTARLINVVNLAEPDLFVRLRDFLSTPERKSEYSLVNITKAAERHGLRMRLRAKEQTNIELYLTTFSQAVK